MQRWRNGKEPLAPEGVDIMFMENMKGLQLPYAQPVGPSG